jgi:hypothetical protein
MTTEIRLTSEQWDKICYRHTAYMGIKPEDKEWVRLAIEKALLSYQMATTEQDIEPLLIHVFGDDAVNKVKEHNPYYYNELMLYRLPPKQRPAHKPKRDELYDLIFDIEEVMWSATGFHIGCARDKRLPKQPTFGAAANFVTELCRLVIPDIEVKTVNYVLERVAEQVAFEHPYDDETTWEKRK